MAYWKIGVAAFIPNNAFKWGHRVGAVVAGVRISGGTALLYGAETIDGESGSYTDNLVKFLRKGDSIIIGPSSATGFEGLVERRTVTSVTTSGIQFTPAITGEYEIGDNVSGIGTNTAGGWIPTDDASMTMGGITEHSQRTLSTMDGVSSRFSQQFKSVDWVDPMSVIHELNLDDFLPNIQYRIGGYYQYYASPADDGQGYAHLTSNSTNFINETISSVNVTTWTEYNSTATASTETHGNQFQIEFGIYNLSSGYGVLNLANVYAEHGAGTNTETGGAYTFEDYPDLNSRKFKILRGSSAYRAANKTIVINDVTGLEDAAKKYIISASFTDVSNVFRENLEILMEWQQRGKYLVLHHDMPNAPTNIQGIMTINDTTLTNWSSGLCSFSISFEEA